MRQEHGLVESIERLGDGRNLALGARTAMELYGHLIENQNVLYGGLGLGVVQRQFALDSDSVTCEINRGVISAFKYIYPDTASRLKVVHADLFDYVRDPATGTSFSMAFLDFHDSQSRIFRPLEMAAMFRVAKTVVINKHICGADDLAETWDMVKKLQYPAEKFVAEGKQLIIKITRQVY